MTKSKLKGRWKDSDFINNLNFPLDRAPVKDELIDVDLRGVPKLGNEHPLHFFGIREINAIRIDFSFGDGALVVRDSVLSECLFEGFKFDRASYFSRSKIKDCSFVSTRMRMEVSDSELVDCSFEDSKFTGGGQYGFTRCTFVRCSFVGAEWKGTYFKACKFIDCELSDFTVSKSLVTAIKHRGCIGNFDDVFVESEVRLIGVLDE